MSEVIGNKKVCHVLYSGIGGHGNVMRSLIEADKTKKYNYSVVFYGVDPVRNEYMEWLSKCDIKGQFVLKQKGLDVLFFLRMFTAFIKARPQVLFLHGSYSILPAALYRFMGGARVIVRETQNNQLKTKSEWWFLRLALKYANRVVFLHETYRKEVENKYHSLLDKVLIIPNGVNLEQFNSKLRQQSKVGGRVIKISMVSRIVKIKDHKTLIRAFAKLETEHKGSVHLYIAGDGKYLRELKKLVNEESLKGVTFMGDITELEIVKLLASTDIYVHATFGETMSTSLLQAGAMACPIVASDVPGVGNMWSDDETALLVPVKSPEKLSEALNRLVLNESLREKLGRNALELVKSDYSNQKMFDKYVEIL